MKKPIALNLGCNVHKFKDFINIDMDDKFQPDLKVDCRELDQNFQADSVDFVHAGHFLEHVTYQDGLKILKCCHKILKPFGSMLITVPDYTKCDDVAIEEAEKVILGQGEHLTLYHVGRLEQALTHAGFRLWSEVPLKNVPYLIYSNRNNPVPDKWQTSVMAIKHLPPVAG